MFLGKAVQILTETHNTFQLNIEALKSVLEDKRIKDKHVVLISIAGELRGGKSFILNFFLRFLQSKNKKVWFDENESLSGCNWKNGDEKDTTGILLWSEPHLVTSANGDEFAVLLMDTQGTFDKKSSVKKNAMIFALSAMVSSIQIFNVRRQILEDKLQFLRLFTCYGRLAMSKCDSNTKPFQHLHFLVRDWPCPYKNPFGMDGGQAYLEKVLHVDESTDTEVIEVRKFIEQCFSRIDCCLLPNPGMKVMNCETFDGKVADIESVFIDVLSEYVPHILSPTYMLPKTINGSRVSCSELLEYFKACLKVFDSDEMPQPVDIFKATTEASNMASVNSCKRFYADQMDMFCGPECGHVLERRLRKEHGRAKTAAIKRFDTSKKFGDELQIESYRKMLEDAVDEMFLVCVEKNSTKNMFGSEVWTLVVLATWFLVVHSLKYGSVLLGLDSVELVMSWLIHAIALLGLLWIGTYLSGHHQMKVHIDDALANSWEYILRPVFLTLKKLVTTSASRSRV